MTDWSEELGFAQHLADVADAITLPAFSASLEVRMKPDGSPVTDADEGAEQAIVAEIRKRFPADAVIGEETGEQGQADGGLGGSTERGGETPRSDRRWIIDPIDGTKNYVSGIPVWATLIALEVSGEIACGVVSAPALGERYAATRGGGATLNAHPISVSGVDRLEDARVAYTSFRSFDAAGRGHGWWRMATTAYWTRGLGDFWGHMLVASGRADVMAEPAVNVWDLAPLIVIVEEAGGRFTDLEGRRGIGGGSALSTNSHLHDQALSLLKEP